MRNSTIPARLQARMESRGLTQGQLAIKSGVSQAHISKIVNGDRDPTADILIKLARALDVSLDWLCDMPSRTPGELTPDEDELLTAYRSVGDVEGKAMVVRVVKAATVNKR